MTTLCLTPSNLTGTVEIPSSKSMGHRELICAALAKGQSRISNVSLSKDILATVQGLKALGAHLRQEPLQEDRATFLVEGTGLKVVNPRIDCGESGSTLRFLLPLAASCRQPVTFLGGGKLPMRPLDPYFKIFQEQGIAFTKGVQANLPLTVQGSLQPGKFTVPGNVSSQFISGLLFALPLLQCDSTLEITETLESKSYVTMTLAALQKYGIKIQKESEKLYRIAGRQEYQARTSPVEGDFSQAAFWLVAGTLSGPLVLQGMEQASLQGDKAILTILKNMGGRFTFTNTELNVAKALTHGLKIDATDCPDLVPVLTVLAAVSQGHTEIINAGRLRLKECDRLAAISTELKKLGALITERQDGLSIDGVESLTGGKVTSWHDHRIAMSLAIASIKCKQPLLIEDTECVEKSYPTFWQDFAKVGGHYE